jgi:hypothetical protein
MIPPDALRPPRTRPVGVTTVPFRSVSSAIERSASR